VSQSGGKRRPQAQDRPQADTVQHIGRAAVVALYEELALSPKPGLVSFIDNGSHDDMDAHTFMRSLFALRMYFPRLAQLGAAGARFDALEREGRAAETRMLAATGGVNTHRGAVFCLGLLCASAGALAGQGLPLDAESLRREMNRCWGTDLARRAARHTAAPSITHGGMATRRFGLRGASSEAMHGFPVLFETTLPALLAAQRQGAAPQRARLQALFETMAVLEDTNLAHRGGLGGLRHAQRAARAFLAAGGALRPDALAHAQAVHTDFVARRLSPGGSADMLAAACWARRVCGPA
jgi:triphosphoribosyl-dephospho-CoA synthase